MEVSVQEVDNDRTKLDVTRTPEGLPRTFVETVVPLDIRSRDRE